MLNCPIGQKELKNTMVKLNEEKYRGLFLKAGDLAEDSSLVKIQRYGVVEIPGQKDPADALYFEGLKRPLNQNKTNFAVLVGEFGDETDDWIGKPVKLVKSMAKNPQTGMSVETIRIKPYVKQPAKK
jgi:hypothetical protein